MPAFQPTVPRDLYEAVADATSEAFADSYLWGAELTGARLLPRTLVAHARLSGSHQACRILAERQIILVEPEVWPRRNGSAKSAKEAQPFRGWPDFTYTEPDPKQNPHWVGR